ncbi:MAG: BTAD domain-containing putative transcriptional regulator, partial [Caulobacteraceae bacterium]
MTGTDAEHARLRLFGRFALHDAKGEAIEISSRRGRALVGYLALAADHEASRERLCGLLWSDRAEAQARASLRQCVLELREALARGGLDLLDIDRERIALRPRSLVSDVDELANFVAARDSDGALAILERTGTAVLLEGLELRGLFEEWLEQTRSRTEQSLAAGVKTLLDHLEAAGDWPRARELAESYLRRDPLDETVVAAAIRADAATGAHSAAHRRFNVLRAALESEFGVGPGAAAVEALAGVGAAGAAVKPVDPAAAEPRPRGVGPPLVVVATFETLSREPATEELASILRDEVVSGLSRFRDLRVIMDPIPLDLTRTAPTADRTGAYVLGARLRRTAEGAALNVQLLRMDDRHVVWSEPFAAPGKGLVLAVDQVIARVVGVVLPTIDADLLRRPSNLPTDPIYHRYLLAREAAAAATTHDAARAAADELEAMVAAFPDFALPYLPLAALYNTDFACTRASSSGPTETARALNLAKRALALDRGHVHSYTVTAWSYLRRRQWRPARLHFDQALELNPFHATRVMEVGYGLVFLGDFSEAQRLLDRCLLLNPAPRDGFFSDLGLLAMLRGDHALAASYFELMASPDTWARLYAAINSHMAAPLVTEQGAEALAGAARERVGTIWPAEKSMTADAVVGWMRDHHPFQ